MAIGRAGSKTVWNIQILRFVASAMVLYAHLIHEVQSRPVNNTSGLLFEAIWWSSGVDVFFVISGFIMYLVAGDKFGQPGAPWRFVKSRLLRLVPPYWFFTLLTLLAMRLFPDHLAQNSTTPWHALSSFLFIPSANPQGQALPVLKGGWTLNYEMLFYVVFAVALLFRYRVGIALIVGVLVGLSLSRLAPGIGLPFDYWRNANVLEFLMGMAVAHLWRSGVRTGQIGTAVLVLIGIVGLVVAQRTGLPGNNYEWRWVWGGLPSMAIVAGFALYRDDGEPRGLRKILVSAGDSSYVLYLSHLFFVRMTTILFAKAHITSATLFVIVTFVTCMVGAWLIFMLLERPVYRWLHKLTSTPARQPA